MTLSYPKLLGGAPQQLEMKFESEAAIQKYSHSRDFPGGPEVKAPCSPCGGHGFNPWLRKIPHAVEQLGLGATPMEPTEL